MNTDCTKPSVAPKPRLVCHASPKLPSPLLSVSRGPKPFIAPKPKVTPELNGNQGGCSNGISLNSDGEVDEEHETQSGLNKDGSSAEKQFNVYILKSPQNNAQGLEDGGETEEEEEEEEEDMIHKVDEEWRLTDSAETEEVGSPETPWSNEAGLTADSEVAAEMVDTDVTEDMDADGCDGGEALADADGLSVGGIDEEAVCYLTEHRGIVRERQEHLQMNEEGTVDDLTESLTDEPGLFSDGNTKDAGRKQVFLTEGEEKDKETVPHCGITCNILGLKCGHEEKEREENLQNVFYDFKLRDQKQVRDTGKKHAAVVDAPILNPHHVSLKGIIGRPKMPKNNKAYGLAQIPLSSVHGGGVSAEKYGKTAENGQTECVSSEDYVEVCNPLESRSYNRDENEIGLYLKMTEDLQAQAQEALFDHTHCQPRFRLVSISVPTSTDTSLTSSLSEGQLLSPSAPDVFEEDLEGPMVPFLDDTTDTEPDVGEKHVYEDPGDHSEGENVFPSHKSRAGMLSSRCSPAELRGQFVHRPYVSGFGQPALSSSPMMSSTRHRSCSKPHYLSLYRRSLSMEGQDAPLGVYSYRDGSPKQGGAICSSGSFSRCSPLSSSGLSTPTSAVDIPPPFELAYITKRPVTKSSPSLLTEGDSSENNRKKKSSIKRFLMLKFRRKTESKQDGNPSLFKSSAESNHHSPSRLLERERRSVSGSPQLNSRSTSKAHGSSELASSFLLYRESKRTGNSVAFLNRNVVRVESFEERSRVPFTHLPLTKPRSISFPNADTSDYENVPAISSDYENLQVPQRRPVCQPPFADFFGRPSRMLSSANDTDGYVDMSSLPGFKNTTQSPEQETESAYTEAYNVCSVAVAPPTVSAGDFRRGTAGEEDQGRTSEEEEGVSDCIYDRQPDGRSRAYYIAKELVDTERLHVKGLKLLQDDFREAVGAAVGEDGDPVLDEGRLREILNELPDVYTLHRRILSELENRIRHWEESQRIADIFLSRKAEFLVFTTYIGHYDRSMSLLEDSCRASPAFAAIVHQFESPAGEKVSLKHQLLQVIVRVAQYRMLLTDYLNNLSPDSKEYKDTQAAVAVVSDIADQTNDSLKHGENLLRLVNIEYSVRGLRDLLQTGRVFVKEGTLMKVSRKSRQPRHLFLMNDVLLYTYPQQDGKYRLKNTLPLTGLTVSKPIVENVQNALKIEGTDISITLSASSFIEREDWFYTLSRTVTEHARGSVAFNSCLGEARDRLRLILGEKAPTLVPVSQVMMCMNCTSDFSLTLRRHHCHGCGRIVCRSCSRNRYPLKYMKDRMAKVCDRCYSELNKKGGEASAVSGKSSPRPNRSSRPLSAVFQNMHPPNIWRHRKGTASFTPVTVSEEGSISGTLQRSKTSKRNWKRLWFLLRDKVLYTYRVQEEKVASESLPLLGFTVKLPDQLGMEEEANIFQLYHKNTLYYSFKAKDNYTAQRWVNAMEEATVL
ncbi:FYVE, RhoGEF and PH domain-containing protein 5b isoform 2-T2 [Spinachia spinachia]